MFTSASLLLGFAGLVSADFGPVVDPIFVPLTTTGRHPFDPLPSTTAEVDFSCECGEPCNNGITSGTCGADGVTCANFFAPVVCPDVNDEPCPDGCTGVQSRMMNALCDDGSMSGPTCEEPSCEWYNRVCPEDRDASSVTNNYDSTTNNYDSTTTNYFYGSTTDYFYSSTSAELGEQADWCPDSTSIAPYCRLAFCDTSDCVAGKQCAMRSGDCTCEHECARIDTTAPNDACSDLECEGGTCQDLYNKGLDPVKVGCKNCDGCLQSCSWWSCEEGPSTTTTYLVDDKWSTTEPMIHIDDPIEYPIDYIEDPVEEVPILLDDSALAN